MIADAVIADAVIADAVIADAVIADAVIADAVIADAVIADAVIADAVIADAVTACAQPRSSSSHARSRGHHVLCGSSGIVAVAVAVADHVNVVSAPTSNGVSHDL
ncbi:MAG: hypothetical protein QM831_42780 [Kofleriaceae bacterium]